MSSVATQLRLTLPDLAATEALGARLAAVLRPGDAVRVKGSLGIRMRQIVAALDALIPAAGAA